MFDQGDAILFFCKYQTFLFRCISESWIEVLKAESLKPNYNYKPVEQSKQTSAFHIFKNPAAIATGLEPNINTQIAAFIILSFLPVNFSYFSSIPDALSPGPPPAVYPLLSPVFHFETQKEYKSPLSK